ncbi:MAG TPA: hypothetical protein VMV09_00270 [Candidatus Saccharimonadales bacterium]|nr:hypothetical protein [Candidatus Saccharimonadales bacterium]
MPTLELRLEVERSAGFTAFDLFDTEILGPDTSVTLEHGATLTISDTLLRKSIDAPTVVVIVLSIPTSIVAAKEVVSWLVGRGPRRKTVIRATVDRKTIEFTEEGLLRSIEEHITVEQDQP